MSRVPREMAASNAAISKAIKNNFTSYNDIDAWIRDRKRYTDWKWSELPLKIVLDPDTHQVSIKGDFKLTHCSIEQIPFDWLFNDGHVNLTGNYLQAFHNLPQYVSGNLTLSRNQFTSLKDIHKRILYVDGIIDVDHNPITSHVLGILAIDNVKAVRLPKIEVEQIINYHLTYGRDVLECQEELIDAGFVEWAKM